MIVGLKVIAPGLHTTVQDFGRIGFQDIGVPVSGAMDTESLRLANALVENPPDEAALEVLFHGPTFEVTAPSLRLALGGAGSKIEVLGEDARILPTWQSVILRQGQVFRITPGPKVSCCYLAVGGGLEIAPCLGSRSTYTRSGIGGFKGRALIVGDELGVRLADASGLDCYQFPSLPEFVTAPPAGDQQVRVTWGAQKEYFEEVSQSRFLAETYVVQPNSDRMGFRLSGARLDFRGQPDIISDGIATGAIQVPGNGLPIVLLADHQTTGGYPKIATVISADLPLVARFCAGQEFCFRLVSVAEAEHLIRERQIDLTALESNIRKVAATASIDINALWNENLISGVTNPKDQT